MARKALTCSEDLHKELSELHKQQAPDFTFIQWLHAKALDTTPKAMLIAKWLEQVDQHAEYNKTSLAVRLKPYPMKAKYLPYYEEFLADKMKIVRKQHDYYVYEKA